MSIDKPTQDKPFTKNDLFWIVTEHGIKFRANKLSQLMGKLGYSIHKEGGSKNFGVYVVKRICAKS